jgi:hypothetical protein
MAHRKSHRRRHYKRKQTGNIVNKTIKSGYAVADSTSKKYMPKVKSGIENLGSNVTETAKQTVPYLQNLSRKFLNMIGVRTRKSGRSRGFIY